ncbi:Transketolase, pyrimidine binding domain-containing protein [Panaeolus papilionaceus]|nr:Transketolase, pyrimidine binding domain-containing protein [Panaeolus papilionaceus]
MKLRQIIKPCERIYGGAVGVQYAYIPDKEQCDWILERIEPPKPWNYAVNKKQMILDRLIWSESFENFIVSKYPNEKRFSLEGCEALIPGMKALINCSVNNGIKHITIGMPHRGHLNALANVIRKPIEAILNEFSSDKDSWSADDVRYHLGANYVRNTTSGKKVSLSLGSRSSRRLGRLAIQRLENDAAIHDAVMSLLHSDAAFGLSETNQLSFTQPSMYGAIKKQPIPLAQYTKFVVDRGTFTEKDIEEHKKWVWGMMEKAAAAAKDYIPHQTDSDTLKRVGKAISSYPTNFTPHRNLARILTARGKTVEEGTNIDWSTAEALAFGSLALKRIHVRVSGQDVERGTFSQRHAVIHDQVNEAHTLGFELGYLLVSPDSLTIWEAQFGDFANNAQCIIDQFIAASERKWLQRTGLVVSLPHASAMLVVITGCSVVLRCDLADALGFCNAPKWSALDLY